MEQDSGHCLLFSSVGSSGVRVAFGIVTIKMKLQGREADRIQGQVNKLEPDKWRQGPGGEMQETGRGPAPPTTVRKTDPASSAQGQEHHRAESKRSRAGQGLAPVLKHHVGRESFSDMEVPVSST